MTASEVVWCIDKDYRTGQNLVNLLNSVEELMKKHEVNIYNLNIPVDDNKDKLANSLVKRGFFKQDLSLFKEINNG
jgi:SOS response regulatory protein OraA/RecX